MKVTMETVETTLGNNGITLRISDKDELRGTLRLGRAKVEWKKKHARTGKTIPIAQLIAYLESDRPGTAQATGSKNTTRSRTTPRRTQPKPSRSTTRSPR